MYQQGMLSRHSPKPETSAVIAGYSMSDFPVVLLCAW